MSTPPKLGQTEIRDITDKIPSNLPTPKIEPVKVDDRPNINTMDSSLTLGESILRIWRKLTEGLTQVSQGLADAAKIVSFLRVAWIPIALCVIGVVVYLIFAR